MSKTYKTALKLFQIVHGKGDSVFEFSCQNRFVRDGWMKLARKFIRLQNKTSNKTLHFKSNL